MIDRLQRISRAIHILRLPSVLVAAAGVAAMATIMATSTSAQSDRYLIPSVIAVLWAMSTYAFIVTFHSVPASLAGKPGLWRRLRRRLARAGYALIAMLFLATSAAAAFASYRVLSIWFRDYGL